MTPGDNDNPFDNLRENTRYAQRYGLLEDPLGRRLKRLSDSGFHSAWTAQIIAQRVQKHREAAEHGDVPPFEPAQYPKHGIQIGRHFETGQPLRIDLNWLHTGFLLAGGTSSGKSNLAKALAAQILSMSRPALWVLEQYKHEFHPLLRVVSATGGQLAVLTPAAVKINLLQADGDPHTHAASIVGQLCQALGIPAGARVILGRGLRELYRRYNIFNGQHRAWPTIHDLLMWVLRERKLNLPAKEAIIDRLGTFCEATPAYRLGWRPSDLANYNIVFEYASAGPARKILEPYYLVRGKLDHAVSRGLINQPLNLIVLLDDAQAIFTQRGKDPSSIPSLVELLGIQRGSGTAVFGSVQSMDGLPEGLLANLSNRAMFRLASHRDYTRLAADMNIDGQQLLWAKENLRPGLMVFTAADGAWRRPAAVSVPQFRLPGGVTDAELADSCKCLESLPARVHRFFSGSGAACQSWRSNTR